MEIRPARPDEYAQVGKLTVSVYEQVLGEMLDDDYRRILADVDRRAAEAEVLVAVDVGGRVLASLTYVGEPGDYAAMGGDEASIRMLAVAPDARRRGLGRALVQACIDRARAAGKARIVLHTTPVMVAAQSMYTTMGFVRHPVTDFALESGDCIMGFALEL